MEKEVLGFFPYLSPYGGRCVRVYGKVGKMTVVEGPSSSGKSSLLEAYSWASFAKMSSEDFSLGLLLLENMKARRRLPTYAYSEIRGEGTARTIYVEALSPASVQKSLSNLLGKLREEKIEVSLPDSLWQDLGAARSFLTYVEGPEMGMIGLVRRAAIERTLDSFIEMIEETLGKEYGWGYWKLYGVEGIIEAQEAGIEEFFRRALSSRKRMMIGISYFYSDGSSSKGIVLSLPNEVLVMRNSEGTDRRILAFHPNFLAHPGVFEAIYSRYAKEGISKEEEAVSALKKEFPWIGGFELIGKELHLKSEGLGGKRVPLYALSDGCRSLSGLSLIYAMSRPGSLVLLDSPEAFLDIRGKELAAEIIVGIAEGGSEVLLATKSRKLINEVLRVSKERGLEVSQVSLGRENR